MLRHFRIVKKKPMAHKEACRERKKSFPGASPLPGHVHNIIDNVQMIETQFITLNECRDQQGNSYVTCKQVTYTYHPYMRGAERLKWKIVAYRSQSVSDLY